MNKLNGRLLALAALLLILSAALVSYIAVTRFQTGLAPEMTLKAEVVGESMNSLLLKIEAYGIPFDKMTGVEEYFASVQHANPEMRYIGMTDAQGKLLHQYGAGSAEIARRLDPKSADFIAGGEIVGNLRFAVTPLTRDGKTLAYLYLGQDALFIQQKMKEITYDVLTVLVVSGLIALELLRFVMAFSITTPLSLIRQMIDRVKGGDFSTSMPEDAFGGLGRLNAKFNLVLQRVNDAFHRLRHPRENLGGYRFAEPGTRKELPSAVVDYIRWPFFLLIFSDSLSLSFFPVFVDTLYSPSIGLPRGLVSGLPISIFMLVWAVSMPWTGGWVDKVGFRRAFIVGAGLTTIGLLLTGAAQGIYDLLLWRSITALGYGMVFITGQSYIARHTPPAQRTKGMATFLATFFAGSLAGAAIGGILADRIGYQMTFFLSASLGLAAAFFVYRFLAETKDAQEAPKKKLSLGDFKILLSNKRFATITFLAAVPAKMGLAGFLYYSAPLYMQSLGSNQSTTGRAMMAYGLAIILLSPSIARMADKLGWHAKFVSIGGYVSALSMFVLYYLDNMLGVVLGITLLGVAHAIGVSPQLALVNDYCKDAVKEIGATTASGIFRLMERLGNVSGPMIAGALIAAFGFQGAFLGIGLICLTCISLFTLLLYWHDRQDGLQSALAVSAAKP